MVSAFDEDKARTEFLVFLRNNDVLSTSVRGVTTTTEAHSGDASTTVFTFDNSNVKNVRSVTVGGASQTDWVDFEVDYINGQITFTNAPASGTDNISIQLDYGTGDKVFDDWPRNDLSISSYPRIAFGFVSSNSNDITLNGSVVQSRMIISVVVYDLTTTSIIQKLKTIRNLVLNNKTSFQNINYITVSSQGPILETLNGKTEILQKNIDFVLPVVLEQ